jgi:hypothetical protein
MVENIIRQPIFDLGQAIKEKSESKNTAAYIQLTDGLQRLPSGRAPGSDRPSRPKVPRFPIRFSARPALNAPA